MMTVLVSTLLSLRIKTAWDLELHVIALLPGPAKLPTIQTEIIKRLNLMPFYITWLVRKIYYYNWLPAQTNKYFFIT
jgi:hypothetical protein